MGGGGFCQTTGLGCGIVYRIAPTGQETILKSFGESTNDGRQPSGPLLQGRDGAFYGATANGGTYNKGTIYRITADGSFSILHSFKGYPDEGRTPTGKLVQAPDGTIFGTTANEGMVDCSKFPQAGFVSCGTIFKIAPDGTFTTLHSFGTTFDDGLTPTGGLLLASDGNLYGTTQNGGTNSCTTSNEKNNCGTLFRISTSGDYTVLRSFGATQDDAMAPNGGLIEGSDGNLYGSSASGGGGRCGSQFGCGTVFRTTKAGALVVLYRFALNGRLDGYYPSNLIFGRDGFLYGTTGSGGSTQADLTGTIFRLTTAGVKTTLFSFGELNLDPGNPSELAEGADGTFYGSTRYNGKFGVVNEYGGMGTIFRFTVG